MVQIGGLETIVMESGSGPDIIMVHGITNTLDVWVPLMNLLSNEYRCIAYNQRLHGGALGLDGDYSLNAYGDDLNNILNRYCKDLSNTILICHSFGCVTAQNYLQRYGNDLKKVILLHSSCKSPQFMNLTLDEFRSKVHLSIVQQAVMNLFDYTAILKPYLGKVILSTPTWVSNSVDHLFKFKPSAWKELHESMKFDYSEKNKQILGRNIHVMEASQDMIVSNKEIVELNNSFSSSTFHKINSGHMSMFSMGLYPLLKSIF